MNHSDLLGRLINLVMSERQAKVYLALLEDGRATSADLQKASGVPQTKIYEIVRYLASQGFCTERKVGHKRTFEATDPDTAILPNISRLESRIEDLNRLKKSLSELYKMESERSEPFEYIEIIHGNENIHNKYLGLLRSTNDEILSFNRPPFASSTKNIVEAQLHEYRKFEKRGGRAKSIFEINEKSMPRMFYLAKDSISNAGEEFRIAPKLPLKMFMFDRKNLLIAERSASMGEGELCMTVIKQNTMVDGYFTLFEFFWEQSATYEEWLVNREELMERKLEEYERALA